MKNIRKWACAELTVYIGHLNSVLQGAGYASSLWTDRQSASGMRIKYDPLMFDYVIYTDWFKSLDSALDRYPRYHLEVEYQLIDLERSEVVIQLTLHIDQQQHSSPRDIDAMGDCRAEMIELRKQFRERAKKHSVEDG